MDKINIKEILRKQCYITKDDQGEIHDSLDNVSMAGKNSCKKVLELAAENAKPYYVDFETGKKINDPSGAVKEDCYYYAGINKQSILDVINLIEESYGS